MRHTRLLDDVDERCSALAPLSSPSEARPLPERSAERGLRLGARARVVPSRVARRPAASARQRRRCRGSGSGVSRNAAPRGIVPQPGRRPVTTSRVAQRRQSAFSGRYQSSSSRLQPASTIRSRLCSGGTRPPRSGSRRRSAAAREEHDQYRDRVPPGDLVQAEQHDHERDPVTWSSGPETSKTSA